MDSLEKSLKTIQRLTLKELAEQTLGHEYKFDNKSTTEYSEKEWFKKFGEIIND